MCDKFGLFLKTATIIWAAVVSVCWFQDPGQQLRESLQTVSAPWTNAAWMQTALASVLITLTFRELLKAYQRYYPNISSHVVLFPLNESISITWDWWCLVSHEYCFSQMMGPVAIFLFTLVWLQLKRYSLIYLYFSKAS